MCLNEQRRLRRLTLHELFQLPPETRDEHDVVTVLTLSDRIVEPGLLTEVVEVLDSQEQHEASALTSILNPEWNHDVIPVDEASSSALPSSGSLRPSQDSRT